MNGNLFLDFVLIAFGYEELIGIEGAKADSNRILRELREYNLLAVLQISAQTIILLYSWKEDNISIQGKLLGLLFSPELSKRILAQLKNKLREEHLKNNHFVIFNIHSVLILMKFAISVCPIKGGRSVITSDEKEKYGLWLLMINNLITETESSGILLPSKDHERIRLRSALARYQFSRHSERTSYKLARYYWIYKCLTKKNYKLIFDVQKTFSKITGLSYETYLSICFSLLTKPIKFSTKPIALEEIGNNWLTTASVFLRNTKFKKVTIKKALDLLIGSFDKVKEELSNTTQGKHLPVSFYYDFLVFSQNPLLSDTGQNNFIFTTPKFLEDRASEGAYWITENNLLKTNETALRNKHAEVWGYAFDRYIRYLFIKSFRKSFKTNIFFDDGTEISDGLLFDSDTVFFIENKHHHWRYIAKITGQEDEMKTTLANLFSSSDKKKGLGQIISNYIKIKSGLFKSPINITGKRVVPMIVISESIPMDTYSRKMYEDKARQAGLPNFNNILAPFIVITAEEAEIISAIAEVNGIHVAINLLKQYSDSFLLRNELGYTASAIPFKNFLYSLDYSIPNSPLLKKVFDRMANDINRRAFGRHISMNNEDVNSYKEIKFITDSLYEGYQKTGVAPTYGHQILELLLKYGIRQRKKDGVLRQVNVSIPTSIANSIVVGLRYIKKDKSQREDHFLFRKNLPIEVCYGKKLEKICPEYKGSHIQQVQMPLN